MGGSRGLDAGSCRTTVPWGRGLTARERPWFRRQVSARCRIPPLLLIALAAGCGARVRTTDDPTEIDSGFSELYALLPPDRAAGDWTPDGAPTLAGDEATLERLVGAAAPNYIDRGWVGSLFARYLQGTAVIEMTAHDMHTETDAQGIFAYDRPASCETLRPNANLESPVSGFETRSYVGKHYLEIVIRDGSDAAKESLKLFTFYVLDHAS
jgi:hypothetical protein